jgi:DNA repair photolyase
MMQEKLSLQANHRHKKLCRHPLQNCLVKWLVKTGSVQQQASNVVANVLDGCSHACKYCCARDYMVKKHGYIKPENWTRPVVRKDSLDKPRFKHDGTVMFPSTHDVLPEFIDEYIVVLKKLLQAGNHVIIITKPWLSCIERICAECSDFKEQILIRCTINSMQNSLLRYWEPGAPKFEERLTCLQHAFTQGFNTAVNIVPILDMDEVEELHNTVEPFVTNKIWIGIMNKPRERTPIKGKRDEMHVQRIEKSQGDDQVRALYSRLKHKEKVMWESTIKSIVTPNSLESDIFDQGWRQVKKQMEANQHL